MAGQVNQIAYTHKDLLKLMLKDQNIHEGYWTLLIRYGFGAGNVPTSADQPNDVNPTALVGVLNVGLQRASAMGPLTVDAAIENPLATG